MDPYRPITVYLPKEYNGGNQRFPTLYCLAPWTSAGRNQCDWQPFKESLPDRMDRLIESGAIPPCIVVCPDLYTMFGGSQYIDSSYLGHHGEHIAKELVPFIDSQFRTIADADSRGVFGRSSGGFGALRLALDYPGVFSHIACHSGDMGFDLVYSDLVSLCNNLRKYRNSVPEFLEYIRQAPKLAGYEVHTLMLIGMAASYSPNTKSNMGFDLPINLNTGATIESVWAKWLDNDPVNMVRKNPQPLNDLKTLYVDCGNRDQYNLHYGARQLTEVFECKNIHYEYQEFDDNHSGTSYRYDISLPLMLSNMGHG